MFKEIRNKIMNKESDYETDKVYLKKEPLEIKNTMDSTVNQTQLRGESDLGESSEKCIQNTAQRDKEMEDLKERLSDLEDRMK